MRIIYSLKNVYEMIYIMDICHLNRLGLRKFFQLNLVGESFAQRKRTVGTK